MELEIEANQSDFLNNGDKNNSEKRLKFSSDYVGISNIGNTCYIASVLQCLIQVPSIKYRFNQQMEDIFIMSKSSNLNEDLNCQLAKIINSLYSPNFENFPSDPDGYIKIEPDLFKFAIGRNHPEFVTRKQQDASEFLLYLLSQIDETNQSKLDDPLSDIRFHSLTNKSNLEKIDQKVDDGYILNVDFDSKNNM